ncbi:MAG: AAA family ATPase [Bacillota bacterium]|nr:AAA family ATPase [Bacillota bacterium]
MSNIYLMNYSVKGIKTLDEKITLSFYKKTITTPIETRDYNVKGIYGMNGSGKSGIVASMDILRNLLTQENYLNNPMVQKNLDSMINKKTKELYLEIEYLCNYEKINHLFKYEVNLKKNKMEKYYISMERLSWKQATSRKEFETLFEVKNGDILYLNTPEDDYFRNIFLKKSINVLSNTASSALFFSLFINEDDNFSKSSFLFDSILALFVFGTNIYVYMDQSDNHTDYYLKNMLLYSPEIKHNGMLESLFKSAKEMEERFLNVFSIEGNVIPKKLYGDFEKSVDKLKDFIQIFKTDLEDIHIDRKENGDMYVCNLIMVYDSYSINTEFESTGIKKLIKLFAYIQKMAQGEIVFIDELDSNLHDVYLCALLEYLMDFGEGQLCFTTHNVGPMDVLKRHKKSIDFLSMDHKIYPWKKNGHYSPSKLYREGMIEGSPFNVDSIDFIGIFDSLAQED